MVIRVWREQIAQEEYLAEGDRRTVVGVVRSAIGRVALYLHAGGLCLLIGGDREIGHNYGGIDAGVGDLQLVLGRLCDGEEVYLAIFVQIKVVDVGRWVVYFFFKYLGVGTFLNDL